MLYIRKPTTVEAKQVTWATSIDVRLWCGGHEIGSSHESDNGVSFRNGDNAISAHYGDWIIKEIDGSFIKCSSEVFDATYKPKGD